MVYHLAISHRWTDGRTDGRIGISIMPITEHNACIQKK